MQRQQRGVILDRAEPGRIEHGLRHEQRHVGHDAQIGVAAFHQLEGLGRFPALRLMHGQALLARKDLERIFRPARLVGGAEYGDDVLLALEQPVEHGLAEGLLSMDDDAHLFTPDQLIPSPHSSMGRGRSYSAAAFFAGRWRRRL